MYTQSIKVGLLGRGEMEEGPTYMLRVVTQKADCETEALEKDLYLGAV